MTWNEITFGQYLQLENVDTKQDPVDYAAEVISILFDIDDPLSLDMITFKKYSEEIKVIGTEIPDAKLKDVYKINGKEYSLDLNVFEWSMSQLIDFRKYSQAKDNLNIAACYIIPKGHKYNDGYDIEETLSDIKRFPITDILKMQSFFLVSSEMCMNISLDYLTSLTKNNKEVTMKVESLRQAIQQLKTNMTSYLMHSPIAE